MKKQPQSKTLPLVKDALKVMKATSSAANEDDEGNVQCLD